MSIRGRVCAELLEARTTETLGWTRARLVRRNVYIVLFFSGGGLLVFTVGSSVF